MQMPSATVPLHCGARVGVLVLLPGVREPPPPTHTFSTHTGGTGGRIGGGCVAGGADGGAAALIGSGGAPVGRPMPRLLRSMLCRFCLNQYPSRSLCEVASPIS